jgi:phenylalanyl-tRNA synthetase beta chain
LSLPKGILLKNPLAENMSMLVTSLIPNLLRSIMQNNARYDECGFFEQNKIWFLSNQSYEEKTVLAAAWFVKQNGRDFYSYKQAVEKIFKAIDVSFEWRKHAQPPEWLSPYESAELILDGIYEGYAGFVPDKLTKELQGSVFVCEIVVDRLLDVPAKKYSYKPVSRYQPVHLDVSIFVPFGITARAIDQIIRQADPRIQSVELIDFFEKPEWGNKRSQTWRYMCSDETKTMSGAEIEEIMLRVHELLKKQGIEIR